MYKNNKLIEKKCETYNIDKNGKKKLSQRVFDNEFRYNEGGLVEQVVERYQYDEQCKLTAKKCGIYETDQTGNTKLRKKTDEKYQYNGKGNKIGECLYDVSDNEMGRWAQDNQQQLLELLPDNMIANSGRNRNHTIILPFLKPDDITFSKVIDDKDKVNKDEVNNKDLVSRRSYDSAFGDIPCDEVPEDEVIEIKHIGGENNDI
ncbi:MAG: hypothetical protein AAFO15_00155 [Pseudomonadota bacterium]